MRPRIALALLCVSLMLPMAACNGGDDGNEGAATPAGGTGASALIPTATPFAQLPAPVIVTAAAGPRAGGDLTYIVEPGDSLSAIASRFDSTVEAITAANGLADADIIVGQELVIPGAGAGDGGSDDDASPAPSTPGTSTDVYVVQSGDTALGIALELDVTLEALAAANGMTVDEITSLQVGQELQIPR